MPVTATVRISLLLALGALAACTAPQPDSPAPADPSLSIAQGQLHGTLVDGIHIFRNIPFAADTGGAMRWRPPGPAPTWTGVRDAGAPGPICPQSTASRGGPPAPWLEGLEISEDCLNLSVYSPGLAADAKRPVMVWIHGGYARIGSGSRYDGSALARAGTVVVTINYRLDRLGLFAHPALSAEHPDEPKANYALLDMLAALRWVQDNIAAFGGDPDRVTIFGQSSGGVAVSALMGSPLSRGLFHGAIAQSGSMADLEAERRLATDLPGRPSLEADGVSMATALLPDLAPGAVSAADLRALPWEELIAYTAKEPGNALVPVTDGQVLPQAVLRAFAANQEMPVPFMTGSTDWEQSLYVHFDLPEALVLRGVPRADLEAVYAGFEGKALVDQYSVDSLFHAPSRFMARAHAANGHPTWTYTFLHVPPGKQGQPGAAHSNEVPYLFGLRGEDGWPRDNPDEAAVAAAMSGYWSRFARSGDPNGGDLPPWAPAHPGPLQTVQLLDAEPRSVEDPWAARMRYHLGRFDRLLGAPASP